jgi:YD repeat-containing protein
MIEPFVMTTAPASADALRVDNVQAVPVAAGAVTLTHDPAGRQTGRVDAAGGHLYDYDPRGLLRATRNTATGATTARTYNQTGLPPAGWTRREWVRTRSRSGMGTRRRFSEEFKRDAVVRLTRFGGRVSWAR